MGQLRAALAAAAGTDPDPARVVAAVDTFAGTGEDTVASSLIYLVVRPDGGVRFALAGHPPGLLVSAGKPTRLLDEGRGPVLGVVPGPRVVKVETTQLGLGDSLVLYTDGLIERRDEPIDDGIERLARAAAARAALGPDELCDELLATMLGGREVGDDVAILVLRRTGPC
jgi:serine phosphatase RsbU (regulator of sigma subunit)